MRAEARERSEEGLGAAGETERRMRRPRMREEEEELMLMFDVLLPLWVRTDWARLAWPSVDTLLSPVISSLT